MMLAKILLLVGVAAAAPCTVKCCMGKWDGNTCNVEVGWQDTNNPLTTLHDTTSGHEQHRCYFDENHVNMCACTCKNEGDEFESTEDGSQLDAATGATASEYKVTGTATLTGVTLDVAETKKFKNDFKSGVAANLGVDSNTVGILSIYQATGRRLLSAASGGIIVEYVIYASSPAAIQQIVQNPSKSFEVEGATVTCEVEGPPTPAPTPAPVVIREILRSGETTVAEIAPIGHSQSSQYSNWVASRANDGKSWTMQHTKGEKNPWYYSKLSEAGEVHQVKIFGRTGTCASRLFYGTGCGSSDPSGNYNNANSQGATIRVSDSPCSGNNCPGTICGRITRSNSAQAFTITCPPGTTGQYVSIMLPGNVRVLHIKEMDVMRFADTTKLVASHSSQYRNWGANLAMDDSESTMQHTKGEKNPWFQVALSSRTHVSSVEVRGRTGTCASRLFYGTGCGSSNPSGNFNNANSKGATIRVSDSPCSGDNCPGTICGRITASNSAQAFTITCPKGTQGKYVSIMLPGNSRVLHIKEMDVMEITNPLESA